MPKLGNSILILSKSDNNKLLAVNRPEAKDKLCLPGGKQELGESSSQGAIRELLEETGISLGQNNITPLFSDFCISQNINYWVTSYVAYLYEDITFNPIEKDIYPIWVDKDFFLKNSYYPDYYDKMFKKLENFLSKDFK